MNYSNILTRFLSFISTLFIFSFDESGWHPIVIDQINQNKQISYEQFSNYTYDFKEGNIIGFNIPYLCDKIRFSCNSNVTFKATTFKNYSSENCENLFTHYKVLPDFNLIDSYILSNYLNKNDIWHINIESKFEISIFNISINDFHEYYLKKNEDYLRTIISKKGIQSTKSYTNTWNIKSNDRYFIILKKLRKYEINPIKITYKLKSNSQCIKKNSDLSLVCYGDGIKSENISYPLNSKGILIEMNDKFDDNIYSEEFECIVENDKK